MELHFQYHQFAWLFLALLLMAGLFGYLLYWKKNIGRRIGDALLIPRMIAHYSANKFLLKFILIVIAFSLGVLAVMNPRKAGGMDKTSRKGIDLAIALDVSKSMLAADMAPSRLDRARQLIQKLMEALPDDRIALVLFAGKAYMQMPLTADHGAASLFVNTASPDAVPQQGTVIADALEMSARVFDPAEKKFKSILLISDGEDHDPDAVSKAAQLAEQGIMINTVGIGSAEGATIPDPSTGEPKKDAAGTVVISKLNEEELKLIAETTNGVYIRLAATDVAVSSLTNQLAQIDKKSYGDISLMNFTSFYPWLAMGMLLFLLIESLITEKRRMRPLLLLMLVPFDAFSQSDAEPRLREGNAYYKKENYQKAAEQYQQALREDPKNAKAAFNLANAYYRQDQKVDAAKMLAGLLPEVDQKEWKNRIYYNKGVILSDQKNLEESIEAYKNALRQDPTDQDARENLQKALLEWKKKAPSPPKKEKKENKKQPQQQQQKQPQSKLDPQQARQQLQLLQQKEKQVQQRIQQEKNKGAGGANNKDW